MVRPAAAKHNRHNTPLHGDVSREEITVTDPTHPLFGRTLKLIQITTFSARGRCCWVELLPQVSASIPLACTDLATEPRPQPTLLTLQAIEQLVAVFQATAVAGRASHEKDPQSAALDAASRPGTQRTHRRGRPHSHRGGQQ